MGDKPAFKDEDLIRRSLTASLRDQPAKTSNHMASLNSGIEENNSRPSVPLSSMAAAVAPKSVDDELPDFGPFEINLKSMDENMNSS